MDSVDITLNTIRKHVVTLGECKLSLSTDFDISVMYELVEQFLEKFPALKCSDEGDSLSLPIELVNSVPCWSKPELLEQSLNIPLKTTGYPWRMVVYCHEIDSITEFTLLLTLSCTVGDESCAESTLSWFINNLKLFYGEGEHTSSTNAFTLKYGSGFSLVSSSRTLILILNHFIHSYKSRILFATDFSPSSRVPPKNKVRMVTFTKDSTRNVNDMVKKKNTTVEYLVESSFLLAFQKLSYSLAPAIDYSVNEIHRVMIFIVPVSFLIVFCYQEGIDSMAWVPCLLMFLIFKLTTMKSTGSIDYFNVSHKYAGLNIPDELPLTMYKFQIPKRERFWVVVKQIEEQWRSIDSIKRNYETLGKLTTKLLKVSKSMQNYLDKKKDIAAIISCRQQLSDQSKPQSLTASSVTFEGCRTIFKISLTLCDDQLIILFTYPAHLVSDQEMDVFLFNFQSVILRASTDERTTIESCLV